MNSLNQYTNRDVPGYVDIKGVSFATNSVTVNSQTAYRKGEYFRKELVTGNGSAALWTNMIVAATGQTSVAGNVFLAKTPEVFGYDLDGNLTNDGRWSYTWDAENRLVNMTSQTNAPAGSMLKLDFRYDSKGRRMQKVVSTNSGSAYVVQSTNNFLYDGWNLVAVLSPQSAVLKSFMWGLDLSGSMQGAGGVGGLLAVNAGADGIHLVAMDGNGNVAALVGATNGAVTANYEYGPFGELVRATGLMAKANPFRFSTKFQDDESDYLYYGYRSYNPNMGRWLSRDPINEIGFKVLTSTLRKPFYVNEETSLYAILHNSALNSIDSLGLMIVRPAERAFIRTACKCAVAQAAYFVIEYGETVWNAMDYITWPGDCVYAKTQGAILFGWFLGFGADAWLEICLDKNCHPKTRYIIFTTRDA